MNQLLLMLEIIGTVVVIYFLTPIIIALFLGAFCPLYQIVEKIYNCMAGLLYPWRWYKQNQKRNEPMKTVIIYTDGACSGNPGPGGWGAILMYGEYKKELAGGEAQTTNNRMELTGVISALEALKKDSGYLFDSEETPPPYSPLAGTQHLPAGKEFNFGFTGVRAPEAKH